MTTESEPVPNDAPTAILRQNSFVAQIKGMIPMMKTMTVVVGLNCSICRLSCISDNSNGAGATKALSADNDRRMFETSVISANDRESITIKWVSTFRIARLLESTLRWRFGDDKLDDGMKAALLPDCNVEIDNERHSTDGRTNSS